MVPGGTMSFKRAFEQSTTVFACIAYFMVCKNLGFTCETEYFGLVECSKETSPFSVIGSSASGGTNNSASPRYYEWINLRNPLGHHGNAGQPYSLAFRVKFWVPAHLILQESVRNIFYMQAKSDLLEGRLRAPNWEVAARLGALLAHGDEIKFDRNALTCEEDDETSLDTNGESRRSSESHENTDDDCSSIASTSDISAVGCVPLGGLGHRDSISKSKKRKLSKQKSLLEDDGDSDNESADIREYSPLHVYEDYMLYVEDGMGPMPSNFLRHIAIEHSKLIRTSAKSAKYWLLQNIFKLSGFGEETFSGIRIPSTTSHHQASLVSRNRSGDTTDWTDYVKTRANPNFHDGGSTQRCDISVGPHGLLITTPDEQTRIPFSAASSATPYKRNFRLVYLSESNEHEEIELKLARPRMAIALYRSITEKHAFYSCETVGTDVTKQFIRDFKVCKNLGFTCETEYFGLVECSKETSPFSVIGSSASGGTNNSASPRYYEWINLRNPLGHHGNAGQPYSLAFRVKFWVPAHLILQESVRNIFYMHAKSDLLEGRLRAPNWEVAARLGALLAHGDEIKFDRNALTCEEDDETSLDTNGESRRSSESHENTDDDCSSIASTSDISAVGCVPLGGLGHRDSISKSKKRKLSKQKSLLEDDGDSDNESADIREYSPLHVYEDYMLYVEDGMGPMPSNFLRHIAIEHSKLIRTSAKSAKYWLLQNIFKLSGFGEETFSGIRIPSTTSHHQASLVSRNRSGDTTDWTDYVKTRANPNFHDGGSTQRCDISVGPHGLLITTPDEQTRIPFSAASSATPYKRNFRLVYLSESNEHEEIELKLARPRMAIALYRSITEKHAFYSCETVGTDVTKQFIRDFKGTIASMFNVYTKLGKLYVFDIQRTYREVYDHARRVLHAKGIDIASTSLLNAANKPAIDSIESFAPLTMEFSGECCGSPASASTHSDDALYKMEKEVAERISEAITCRICMDREIDTSFTPCGHITSCHSCAEKCETCPLCRAKIACVNKIYLPTELRSTALNIFNGFHTTSEHTD